MGAGGPPPPPQLRRARLSRRLHPHRRSPACSRRSTRPTSHTSAPNDENASGYIHENGQRIPIISHSHSTLREERRGAPDAGRHPDRAAVGRVRRPVLLRRGRSRPRRGHPAALRRPQLAPDRSRRGGDHHHPVDHPRAGRRLLRKRSGLDHLAVLRPDLGLPGHPARDRARYRALDQRLPSLGYQHRGRQPLDSDCSSSHSCSSRTSGDRCEGRSWRFATASSSRRRPRRARARSESCSRSCCRTSRRPCSCSSP